MKTIIKTCMTVVFFFAVASLAHADNSARKTSIPYQVDFSLDWIDGDDSALIQTVGNEGVPKGMYLIVKNVNYLINAGVSQTGHCALAPLFAGPELALLPAPVHWVVSPTNSRPIGFGNVSLEIFIDEGDYRIACNRSGKQGSGSVRLKVTGYLMPN